MKDCIAHIFSNGSATLINDSKQAFNRLCIVVILLLGFITPHFVQAQHIDNRKRLDSFQRARTATTSSIFKILANSYTVTGGGAYCAGGSGMVVGLDNSQKDTTYQLQLNGVDIGSPVMSTIDGPISFGLQTAAGTYTVFANTINGPVAMNGSATIVINPLPTPSAGSNTPQCAGSTLNLTASGGSTYSWTGPNGFTSNSATPSIPNVTTAASGLYTVTVTDGNSCSATTTTNVVITPLPTANLSYAGTPFCRSVATAQPATLTGTNAYTGGTYSAAPGGLSINSSTGEITPSTSTAGTYTVTYTTPASGGCAGVTATASVTITAIPTATISYTGTPFCTTLGSAPVTLSGTGAYTGGTFSAPGGLTINSTTGEITTSSSTPGTYTITYATTASGGCASVNATTSVTITALPTVSLSYTGTPFCRSLAVGQSATLNGTGTYTGGTYSAAPGGLSINASTGAITPSTSTAGTYTVTYTTPASGGCATVTATASVTITAVPTATISYTGTPFCTTLGSAPVTLSGTGAYTGGTFSAPGGLTINSTTGEITTSSSTPGTYTVTYATTASGGCASVNATTSVTITALPTVSLSYTGTPFCRSLAVGQSATLNGTGAYTGGTYSAAPGGLSINASTGAITPSTSTAGTYTVTYTTPASGGCATVSISATVVITDVPTATISYAGTPFCTTAGSTAVTLSGTGAYTGGTFSAPAGLNINGSTGAILPSASTAGTYTVTYAIPASGGCASVNATTSVTITALPTVALSYVGTPYCRSLASAQSATLSGTGAYTGGTYTAAPGGLSINASTGAITPSASTAGTYTVTYTSPASGGCTAVTATASVTITAVPTATISYTGTPFCTTVSAVSVTLSGTGAYIGGTYTVAPAGLSINSSTGDITPSSSTAGSYTVTYSIPASGGCAAVNVTTPITITAAPTASLSYAGTPFCKSLATGQNPTLTGTNAYTGGTYTAAPAGLTITGAGVITPSTSTAGTYTVTYTLPASGGCAAVTATASVTITAVPTATISYTGTPFCTTASAVSVTLSGTGAYTGGTYTAAPAGLTINSSTGDITPSSSSANTYTVTYAIPASGGCAAVNVTTSVTITAQPTANLSYAGTPFCKSLATGQNPTLTGTNAYTGGTYTAAPAGLSIVAGTGVITPSTSTAGTYTVTYTKAAAGGCAAAVATASVTITAVPTATISYAGTPFCTTAAVAPVTLTGTGAYTGGTYTAAPSGLTINSSTGDITPSSSSANTYTVTYAIPASGGCAAVNVTTSVTITAAPTANLSYSGTPFCRSIATAQTPTLTGTNAYTGGTYTASGGLTINSSTGAFTPSANAAGTYTITYTKAAAGGCPALVATTSVTITAVPTATISYAGTPFCTTAGVATVTLSGTGAYTGGTYTAAPAGLTINSSTGDITPSSSSANTYTVTYAIPASGGCAAVNVTTSVTITAQPTANLSYAGTPFCKSLATGQNPTLTGTNAYTGGTYTAAPAGLSIVAGTGVITPSTSTAGTYTVTYTKAAAGGCAAAVATASVTITAVPTATISYAGTPFCITAGVATVTLSGTGAYTGGTYTAAPSGLTINSSTGDITPSSSTAGTYTVTYAIPASGGCASVNATTSVTITAAPTASLSYAGTPFCKSLAAGQNPTLTGTNAYTGGTYTAAPAGLSIVSGTGVITPSTSTAGTYTVTYTKAAAGGCAAVVATASVTITAVPTATISYTGSPFCTTVASAPVTLSGTNAYTGGTFSAPAGLTINTTTGEITPSSSTAGTYTITYATPASGGCASVNATTSVTITAMPTASLTYAGNPFCRSVSTAQAATLTGTGVYTGGTYSASPAGLSIVSGTGAITPSTSTAGTYTVTYTKAVANGCAAISTTTSVTITSAPTATISYTGTPFCTAVSSASVNLSGTGAYTGGTFSAPAGLTINSTTGAITPSSSTAGTYTVTYAVPSSGGCAAVNATTSVTINASPTISVTPASAAFCSGNSVTLTASGASTYTWSPSTNLSITTGSVVIAYPDVTTTYTVTGTAANGCTGTANVTVTVIPSPEGDLSSSPPVCSGSNSGTITLSNYTGTIIRWETSTDGGTNWTTVNNTGTTFPYLNLTTTTIYRVYLQLNSCFAYSDVGIVPVNPPFTPTVTVTPASICPGQTATLKASDYGAPPFPVEDFQNANPAGWSGNDANNNNKGDNSEWGETGNGKTFNGITFNSNAPPTNTKFMIVNGNGGGSIVSLITPPFSLIGLTNPIFSYYTAMNLNVGATAWVEISTDGGTNYNTLKTYTGPTNVGNPNNGFIQESINLSAYIGQPNVKVRFRYSGNIGSNWAVDNVGITGTYQPVTYQWSPLTYLTPANGVGQTVTTTPTISGTYNYCVVATTAAGCSSSPVCADVLVKPLPACSISGTDSVCPASTNTYSAPAGFTYSWNVTGKGTISGSSTGQTVSVLASRTCGTFTLNLTTTLNGCTSTCSRSFTIYDTTRPVITVTAAGTLSCNPAASAILAAFGTATVTDNCTTGLTATATTGAEQGTGCIRTVTRTWTVTDSCGNSATASQTVSFTRDTQGPTFVGVPANTTAQCDGIPAAPTVTANDNCSPSVAVTFSEVNNVAEGCGTITRTWSSTDLCGNTSTATQILTVVDTTRPVFTGVPANTTVQCTNPIPAGFSVTATDNCDPTITVNFTETNNVAQGCGTITRTWTATDACGNTATATQVVTVVDNTAPVATAPATQSFQCLADVPAPGTLTATDNCSGNITATGVDVQVANGCGYTITRTWTFTDACNNTSSVSQIINVHDNIPPVITCPPAQAFCAVNSNTYTIPTANATDNCVGALNITYQITGATTRNGTGNDASGVFNVGISTITWTVTDICGNTSTCTTTVTINPKPAPIIYHN